MSAAGQPIDPVLALSQQAGAQTDPVEMLAAGHAVTQSAAPPAQQKPGFFDRGGMADAVISNLGNGASFNLGDPAASALAATFPSFYKGGSQAPSWGQRYSEDVKKARADTTDTQRQHPYVSFGSSVVGGMANPVNLVLPTPAGFGGAVAQGAALGGAYGAGGSVGSSNGLGDALKQTASGALTGAAGGAAAYGLGALLKGGTRTPYAQILHDEGVPLTIGESGGGAAQTLEDATTHIPLVGNAIKSRQFDATTGFNRAFYNRVLEPLGVKYAADGPVGNDGIAEVSGLIDGAYKKAYDGAQVAPSNTLSNDVQSAVSEAANKLAPAKVAQIQGNVNRLLTSKMANGTPLAGDDFQIAKNWFAEQSRSGPTASLDDRAVAGAYKGILDALKDGIRETDPDRGALLDAADHAYARFLPVQQAAGLNNASAKAGIFTAHQIGNALRSSDNSVHRAAFARGLAPMQDLAQAGQHVLPTTVPDSGTALRGLLELGAGGIVTHEFSPEAAVGAAGLIGSGAALYSKPGQALAKALIYGAPGARKAMGALPRKALPGLLAAVSASAEKGGP